MKSVNSREFQGNYHRYTEPVDVYRYSEFMGRWFPVGTVDRPIITKDPPMIEVTPKRKPR